jgi:rhodanese-related sulfurtransferase
MKYAIALVLLLGACSKADKAGGRADDPKAVAAAAEQVATVEIDDLDAMLAAGACETFDANSKATRERQGVIPGAKLLADHDSYPLSVLPADKAETLVFYCANEQCGASHKAAARAVIAGYTDVKVLPAGIAGWKAAGKPTQEL